MRHPPRRTSPRVAAFFAALAATSTSWASPDNYGLGDRHHGAHTATPSQVVNTYAAVTTAASPGATAVTVASATGIAAGDLVLVWQVQGGAYMSGAAGPVPLSADTAGNYDVARVTAVTGATLTIAPALTGTYAAVGAQVIRVPEYTTVNVPTGASLTAPAWNGATGGVVAFLATGRVTLAGAINANALGGRGGAASNNF